MKLEHIKNHIIFIFFLYINVLLNVYEAKSQNIASFTVINTANDDYAATFRSTCEGNEIWLTTERTGFIKGSRKIVYFKNIPGKKSELIEAPYPINQRTDRGVATKYMDGVPTFSSCDPNYGVFVSNRLVNGKSYDNDLYEMILSGDQWTVRRLDEINSDGWDDTPSLSADGRFLYFASDRKRPGVGISTIFVSQRLSNGKWSPPDALDIDGFDIQTPLVHTDGFLYYSVDRDGSKDFDIWRVRLDKITGKPIKGTEEPLNIRGVNQKGTIEGHPIFSPSGAWLIFSSNNTRNKDKDLFYCLFDDRSDTLKVKQIFRTFVFDSTFMEYVDAIQSYNGVVEIQDLNSGKVIKEVKRDKDYSYIAIPFNQGSNPLEDFRIGSVVVKSNVQSIKHISMVDTLYYDKGRNCNLIHELTIWDINVLENPKCEQNFPVINIPFFLTSYWCPTTKKYKNYTPCQSIFADEDCTSLPPINQPCPDNDLWDYRLIPAKVEKVRQSGLCIPQKELDQFAESWSIEVDSAITNFISNMSTALQKPCIKRAIKQKKPIIIEVIGWTDPRAIDNACLYTGRDIDFNKSFVKLKDIDKKGNYIPNGFLKKGTQFTRSPFGGNQLLSDLRAFYTAVMLDSLWTEKVVLYQELKENNLIEVIAVGKSVNPENIARERQRSVNVVIYSSVPPEQIVPGKSPELGRAIALCASRDCLTSLLCKELENTLPDENDFIANRLQNKSNEVVVIEQTINKVEISIPTNIDDIEKVYTLQVVSTPSENEAREIIGKLINNNLPNIQFSTYTNRLGTVYYRVRVGLFYELKEAKEEQNRIKNILLNYGIDRPIDIIIPKIKEN